MTKNIISIFASALFLFLLFLTEALFVSHQFEAFKTALHSLYYKIEDGSATTQDGESVRTLWRAQKNVLHVFIPHNDVVRMDYYLGEAVSYLYSGEYVLALAKAEVLVEICENLPATYKVSPENIF